MYINSTTLLFICTMMDAFRKSRKAFACFVVYVNVDACTLPLNLLGLNDFHSNSVLKQ